MKKIILALLLVLSGLTGCSKKDNEMNHEFNNEFVYYHAYGSEHYRNDTPVIDDNTIDKVANQKKSLMFYHFIFLKQIMYKTKKHLLRVNAT